ncbi:MAG: hypothetical protein KC492_17015 [Myxococcales bacterium]|nr:hypothetical protein [Myxococcales bacterium]
MSPRDSKPKLSVVTSDQKSTRSLVEGTDAPRGEQAQGTDPSVSERDLEWLALEEETPDDAEWLSEEAESDFAEQLRAAFSPLELSPQLNQTLIELALEDPFAEADEEEQAESERLREALDLGESHPLADLARSVHAAADPGRIDAVRNQELLEAALAGADRGSKGGNAKVIRVAFGAVTAVLAAAAGMLLWVQTQGDAPNAAPSSIQAASQELAVSRSTASLFHEKFDTKHTSERVDRIAMARAKELRKNRYASWGAR